MRVSVSPLVASKEVVDGEEQYEVKSSEESDEEVDLVRTFREFKALRKRLPTLDKSTKFPTKSLFVKMGLGGLDHSCHKERALALESWLAVVIDSCDSREIDDDGATATRRFLGLEEEEVEEEEEPYKSNSHLTTTTTTEKDDDIANPSTGGLRSHQRGGGGTPSSSSVVESLRLQIIQREERNVQLELENADLRERIEELGETRAELERARLAASRDRAKLLAKCEALAKERDSLSRQNDAISRRHQSLLLQIGGAQLDSQAKDAAPNRPPPPALSNRRGNPVCFGGC